MKLLEVEGYGDFDQLYTYAIHEISKGTDLKELLERFKVDAALEPSVVSDENHKQLEADLGHKVAKSSVTIDSGGISGIDYLKVGNVPKQFSKWLEQEGFHRINTRKVRFSD